MRISKNWWVFLTLLWCSIDVLAQKPIGNYGCGHRIQTVHESNKAPGDIDGTQYLINLDITDFTNQRVSGYTDITFKATTNLSSVTFNLEGLTVDSIIDQMQPLSYSHTGINLEVTLASEMTSGASKTVRVYYAGSPKQDATWGGFYFSGEYAFNVGVAFTSEPHNYGRVWFPCIDNFTDRALYDFSITCSDGKFALCNGVLTNEVDNGDGTKRFDWKMDDPIPTYLVSVAVAPYTFSQWLHESGVPVVLSAVKSDSLKMAESFLNLNKCISAYIKQYGPHTFDRVGFNLVPFNGGAMEHATNIAYPRFGADGQLTYETLYAHELGHHWWGNTVTCRTAEDMWINEGWASYSERVFLEAVYGSDRYDDDISANHRAVLHYAHLQDGDTLPVSGIGHENTYGMHVYDKGADVVHTLRGYMGDSNFFDAVRSFLVDYKFKDVSSDDLKTHFQKFTTTDLSSFFDNWIYNPGFPHFEILGYTTTQKDGKYETEVDVRQRLRFAPNYFTNVPMDFSLYYEGTVSEVIRRDLSGNRQKITFTTDKKPLMIALDVQKNISDAITDDFAYIVDTGSYSLGDAMMDIHANKVNGRAFIRVEHNWVGADAYFVNEGSPFLSRERYWTVDGVWDNDFDADATIEYFGRETGTNYPAGYLDVDLIRNTEEGMVLMYRPNASVNWEVCADYDWEMGSKFDKRGNFTIHGVRKGQYAFAIDDESRLSTPQVETQTSQFVKVFPNPTDSVLNIEVKKAKNAKIEVTDLSGRLVYTEKMTSNKCCKPMDVSYWKPGIYLIGIVMNDQPYKPLRVLVK